jgi:hypothetical protein
MKTRSCVRESVKKMQKILADQHLRIARQDAVLGSDLNSSFPACHRRQTLANDTYTPEDVVQCEFLNDDEVDSVFKSYVSCVIDIMKETSTTDSPFLNLKSRHYFCLPKKFSVVRRQEVDTVEDLQNDGSPFAVLIFENHDQLSTTSLVSCTGRAIVSDHTSSLISVTEHQITFPCEPLREKLLAHLNSKPRTFNGACLPHQDEFDPNPLDSCGSPKRRARCLEVWKLVKHDHEFPEGSNVLIDRVIPGAKFLVEESGKVEIAFQTSQSDIVLIDGAMLLESSIYSWESYISDIPRFEKRFMNEVFPHLATDQIMSDEIKWKDIIQFKTDTKDLWYSPEIITQADKRCVHRSQSFAGAMYLEVGQWVETVSGRLGLIKAMNDDGSISKIQRLLRFEDFTDKVVGEHPRSRYMVILMDEDVEIGAFENEAPFLALKVKPGVSDLEFHSSLRKQGHLLPISLATLYDREGTGNLFVVGIASRGLTRKGRPSKLVLHGVDAPDPRRIFDMLAFLGMHMKTFAEKDRLFQRCKFEVENSLKSLTVDDSLSTESLAGTKSNSFELHCLKGDTSAGLSFVSQALSEAEALYGRHILESISVSTLKGINLKFVDARILNFMICKAGESESVDSDISHRFVKSPYSLGDAMQDAWTISFSDSTRSLKRIRISGQVAVKVLFYPIEGFVITLSGWDFLNSVTGVSMSGTGAIDVSKRIRALDASPFSVLKKGRTKHCFECFPNVCSCQGRN